MLAEAKSDFWQADSVLWQVSLISVIISDFHSLSAAVVHSKVTEVSGHFLSPFAVTDCRCHLLSLACELKGPGRTL